MSDYALEDVLRGRVEALDATRSRSGLGVATWQWRGAGELTYHRPDHHTFSLYLGGGNHVRPTDGGSRPARCTGSPGAICVMPANSETAWNNRGYVRWMHVYFDTADLLHATDGRSADLDPVTFGCDVATREMIERFVLALDWHSDADAMALDHALHALVARVVGLPARTSAFRGPRGGLTGAQRRVVEEAVREHLGDEISLRGLAEVAGLSVRQFSRAFRASYGVAPYAWVLRRRVEVARAMLERGRRPDEVAAACGFGSQSHMIRRFRQVLGSTPTAFVRARSPP